MTNGRPHWTFGPAPGGRQPPEIGGQLRLLQRKSINLGLIHEDYTDVHAEQPRTCNSINLGLVLKVYIDRCQTITDI